MKLNKAVGPDGISHRTLKELADFLAAPVAAIINSSLQQGVVPDQWKISRITPVPKLFPPRFIESDIRPIAVTNAITKIAEKFVSNYFNEFFDNHTYINQFGCVHGRSTTQALLKVIHELFVASDCSQNIIRILFVKLSTSLNILFDKFVNSDVLLLYGRWT